MLARWYLSLRHRCWAIGLTQPGERSLSHRKCGDSGRVSENHPRHEDKGKGQKSLNW